MEEENSLALKCVEWRRRSSLTHQAEREETNLDILRSLLLGQWAAALSCTRS